MVLAQHSRRHLPLLAAVGLLGLAFMNWVNDSTWDAGGHPYYSRRTADPEFKLTAFLVNLFSPERGMLTLSPILMVAIVGVWLSSRSPTAIDRPPTPVATGAPLCALGRHSPRLDQHYGVDLVGGILHRTPSDG
jgi:hypothetical protein